MFQSRKVAKSKSRKVKGQKEARSLKVKGQKEARSLSIELFDNSTLRPFDLKLRDGLNVTPFLCYVFKVEKSQSQKVAKSKVKKRQGV